MFSRISGTKFRNFRTFLWGINLTGFQKIEDIRTLALTITVPYLLVLLLPTLCCLWLNEGLDERVGRLCVQRQGISEWLQFRTLVEECLLEAVAASVEVLFDSIERHIEHGTLLRRHVRYLTLLHVFGDILSTAILTIRWQTRKKYGRHNRKANIFGVTLFQCPCCIQCKHTNSKGFTLKMWVKNVDDLVICWWSNKLWLKISLPSEVTI